jgi:hypothetical protein
MLVKNIPRELQLESLLQNYNGIAMDNSIAHSCKPIDYSRAIWHYGFGKAHSISRF